MKSPATTLILMGMLLSACAPSVSVPAAQPTTVLGPELPVNLMPKPVKLDSVALEPLQERQVRLAALAWSPNRKRFAYLLNDEIIGPDASQLQSLRLRDPFSQQEQQLELPQGRVAGLWWLDSKHLVFSLQEPRTAPLTPQTPARFKLYRLEVESGERIELKRFDFDGRGPELYSLHAQNSSLLYLDAQGGKIGLNVLDGLTKAANVYPTELNLLQYDALREHRLYLPDSQHLILLAGRRLFGKTQAFVFDLYCLDRSSGDLTKLAMDLMAGEFELSSEGRYLIADGQFKDLLTNTSVKLTATSAYSEYKVWSLERIMALSGESPLFKSVSWLTHSGSLLAKQEFAKQVDDGNVEGLKGLVSVADQGLFVWRDNQAWFTPLAEKSPNPVSAFKLNAEAKLEILAEPGQPVVLQYQPEGTLKAKALKPIRLKVYGLSGGVNAKGFYPLLEIQVALPEIDKAQPE